MELNKIKQRLELALRPVEKPPTIEEVLKEVSARGVLRGPVDWVFPAWMLYVEYATQKIAETFPLSEEEKRQLFHFRDTLNQLLLEAQRQAKEKLAALYKAVVEGTYRLEGKRLNAPDGTWMYAEDLIPRILIRGVTAKARFPDLLKLPRERLELLQLGWRASDESRADSWPEMNTSQPWQVFAWVATRYGELYVYIASANLTREGVSVSVPIIARSWKQKWSKTEAIDLVASHFRRGEWAPLLTAWLGDGQSYRKKVLRGDYKIIITGKEPWRLGNSIDKRRAIIATGKEAFVKLKEAAGTYGALLDLLRSHKWIDVLLAADKDFKTAYKLKARKRNIDVLRETYGYNNGKIPTGQFSQANKQRRGAVVVAGVAMNFSLRSGKGTLQARCYVRDVGEALVIAGRLESARLRPNVIRVGSYYMVYIATADILKLAERDEAVRRALALYLAEKVKNGTPKQRETAEKILKRHPLFSTNAFLLKPTTLANVESNCDTTIRTQVDRRGLLRLCGELADPGNPEASCVEAHRRGV